MMQPKRLAHRKKRRVFPTGQQNPRPFDPARFAAALSTSISPHPHLRATIQSLAATLPFRSNPFAQSPAHRTYRSLKQQLNPPLLTTFMKSID